jgi:hypothetical protein
MLTRKLVLCSVHINWPLPVPTCTNKPCIMTRNFKLLSTCPDTRSVSWFAVDNWYLMWEVSKFLSEMCVWAQSSDVQRSQWYESFLLFPCNTTAHGLWSWPSNSSTFHGDHVTKIKQQKQRFRFDRFATSCDINFHEFQGRELLIHFFYLAGTWHIEIKW